MPTPVADDARPWFLDALSAFAFWCLAFVGGKGAGKLFGPFGALFVFLIAAGLGWAFGRAAWRGYTKRRRKERRTENRR